MAEDVANIFFEIHSGLPREGPGDDESTQRAYDLVADLPERPRILDIGCGPGAQTIELARISNGTIIAIDTHQPFIVELERRAETAGFDRRVFGMRASMSALPFADGAFDLIWCEGAMYFLGFGGAIESWRRFLVPRGYVVVTEPCWLRPGLPAEVSDFWAEYPAMTTVDDNECTARSCGFEVAHHFAIPNSAWESYYSPMEKRIAELRAKYAGSDSEQNQLNVAQKEIDVHRKHERERYYGYVFFVMRRLD